MTLEEIRVRIDEIDGKMKELFLTRMNIATEVASSKNEAGSTQIYRADREAAMIERLTADVSENLVPEYAAFIRKTIEVSRMYQYGLLYDWNPSYGEELLAGIPVEPTDTHVKLRLTRPDNCNAMSAILCMIGDYGFNMEQMQLLHINKEEMTASFELSIRGNLLDPAMRKLMFQLSKEALAFEIIESYHE